MAYEMDHENTVWLSYNAVNFLQNPHKNTPIAHLIITYIVLSVRMVITFTYRVSCLKLWQITSIHIYCQTFNIRHILVGNTTVDHSHVVAC